MELGTKVRDEATAFSGTVVAVTHYLHGSSRYGVQGMTLKDGIPTEWQWFEEGALELAGD